MLNQADDKKFTSEKDIQEYVNRQLSRAFTIEQVIGAVNGTNVRFNTSASFGFIMVFENGVLQHSQSDYTIIDSRTIIFATPPATNSKIVAVYSALT